jgi:hypothetical protein
VGALEAVSVKISPVVTFALAAGFLASSWMAHDRGEVIRKQSATLAELDGVLVQYERGAETIVRSYESANLRAQMALAAYDRCRGLMGVSAP